MQMTMEFTEEADTLFGTALNETQTKMLERLRDISISAYDFVNLALINCTSKADTGLYLEKVFGAAISAGEKSRVLGKGLSAVQKAEREAANKTALDRGDPLVRKVLAASQKAGSEIHRIMGFLRFLPLEIFQNEKSGYETFYIARCAPDHFFLRFGEQPWAIIDEKRSLILIRRPGKRPSIEELDKEENEKIAEQERKQNAKTEADGNNYSAIWQLYHKAILIENRKNVKLQKQFIPLRYRKYLCEFC